jgi:hypothetical protein
MREMLSFIWNLYSFLILLTPPNCDVKASSNPHHSNKAEATFIND